MNDKTTDRCECGAMSAIECGAMPGRHCGMWEKTDQSETTKPEGCVAVWRPGKKPDPGTMYWIAPDGTEFPATDDEQAENAVFVQSMRAAAQARRERAANG